MQRIGCFALGFLLACSDSASDSSGTGAGGGGGDPTGGTSSSSVSASAVTSSSATGSTSSTGSSSSSSSTGGGGGDGGGGSMCAIEAAPGGTMPDPGMPGVSQLLATDAEQIWGTALANDHLYWTSGSGPGRLLRVPKDGGEVEALASDLVDPYGPVIDNGFAYIPDTDGAIKRVPIDGGCTEVIVSGQDAPGNVVLDATHLYFTDFATGQVGRVTKAGGAVEILATGQANPGHVGVLGDHVYWLNRAGNVVDEGSVARVEKTGGAVETILTGLTVPYEVEIFQGKVFFTSSDVPNDTNIFWTYDPAMGMATMLLPDGGRATEVTALADTLTFGHVFPHVIRSFTPGQPVADVVAVADRPFYLDQDATHVFWAAIDVGELLRVAKP